MREEYIRVAAAVPPVVPAGVSANTKAVAEILRRAEAEGARVVVLPELCLTGYTCADLFYQPSLLDAAEAALAELLPQCGDGLVAIGLPVRVSGRIYNCAAIVAAGRLVGVVPKTYLPSTHEFYESRWFASALDATEREVTLAGASVPFGNDLIFDLGDGAVVGVELCEDMWTANPPSTRLSLRGANVILNLSASNELVGKTEYRRSLVTGQSARCLAAYAYAGAGVGESTTDLVFGGHTLIAENGAMLAEGPRFSREPQLTVADVDVGFLDFERSANFAFRSAAKTVGEVRRVVCTAHEAQGTKHEAQGTRHKAQGTLLRPVDPYPFVPRAGADRDARCEEILAIQSTGLATRLKAIRCANVVLGLSGGLDSALALLVCVEAFDRLGLDRKGIHAYTLPGFGTTARTKGNADTLCAALGVPLETIDITPMARQHLKDLGRDESVHDITYENTQARGRTYILMDKANQVGGILVGTGDLSELALGWCTYNGDHMSMYGVNAGVPKTLVRHLVAWYAAKHAETAPALNDILATPVSPELLPPNADGTIAQITEDKVGPYDLHDFFLYHFLRRGARKEKIRALAEQAFAGTFDAATIAKWLDVFFKRFYSQQFKRSCMPDGPKVGSLNLSPRGDWRMPSDAKPL
jgi:NAD+ synthase (glutamine-hydrolysing)